MKEIWKDIRGYEGKYRVSNLGRVKSLDRSIIDINGYTKNLKGMVLKNILEVTGYERIMFGGRGRMFIHQLIAIHFIPNPENKPCINHKDGNKLNNDISNLEWCTRAENNKHAYQIGLMNPSWRSKFGKDHPYHKKVNQYDMNGNFIKMFYGVKEAGRRLGINPGNISSACLGRYKSAGNFRWRHVE